MKIINYIKQKLKTNPMTKSKLEYLKDPIVQEMMMDFACVHLLAPHCTTAMVNFEKYTESLQPKKSYLFKTEDGKELFEGDSFVVTKDFEIFESMANRIPYGSIHKSKSNGYIIFSTERVARDYIIQNKPCLSLQDLVSVGHKNWTSSPQYLEFLNLVKKNTGL